MSMRIKKLLFWCVFCWTAIMNTSAWAQMGYAQRMNLEINNKIYSVVLENNITTEALRSRLPMTLNMEDLYGSEKYAYITEPLPMQPQRMDTINAGDVLLWGNDCLVIFYNHVSTLDEYTKIGHIENVEDLAITAGSDSVNVTWFR